MNNKKDAICMIFFKKDFYLIGACISGYIYKLFIKKLKLEIELIIMCDSYIYKKYKNILSKYFDKIFKIQIITIKFSDTYKPPDKYEWVNMSFNKWQCLKYIMYNKILFVDIDVIPKHEKFFEIFKIQTPAIAIRYGEFNLSVEELNLRHFKCIDGSIIYPNIIKSNYYDEYLTSKPFYTLDASLFLFKPNKQLYTKYISFVKKIYKNGVISHLQSGPDETSLFYFLFKIYKKPIYKLCLHYLIIPWDYPKNINKNAIGYNLKAYIKPWYKPKFLQWKEEMIWIDIFNKMPKSKELEELLYKFYLKNIKEFNKLDYKLKKKYYNLSYYNKYKTEINKIQISKKYMELINRLENRIKYSNVNKYGLINIDNIFKLIKGQ